MTRRLVVALGAAVLALGIAEIRASEAEPIDLGTAFGAAAYAADIEAQAYRVGADAAQAARIDPARAESIVAARYREALTLATDEAARGRIKAAFQRGYQEAVASAATDAAAPAQASGPPSAGRIFDITTARDVAWGQPVGPSTVFTPDTNPIYVWLHHQGLEAGTTIKAVWYFLGTATPTKIGEGSVTVTPPADWGQFNYELAAGKRWPAGDYRIELLIGTQPVAEARFQVAAAPGLASPAPAAPAAPVSAGVGQRYTDPSLGYSLTIPAGWAIDAANAGEGVALRPAGSNGQCSIYARPAQTGGDATSAATGWEGNFLRPGSGTNLHTKVRGREIAVGGSRAYEGLYRGDEITAKAVFVAAPARILIIVCMFMSPEFLERVNDVDQLVGSLTMGALAATPAVTPSTPPVAPPPATPSLPRAVKDLFEGLGRILRDR